MLSFLCREGAGGEQEEEVKRKHGFFEKRRRGSSGREEEGGRCWGGFEYSLWCMAVFICQRKVVIGWVKPK